MKVHRVCHTLCIQVYTCLCESGEMPLERCRPELADIYCVRYCMFAGVSSSNGQC